ncbi:MAG: hypothetical protein HZC43_10285 [Nitrosomonadales bacterium]|nr:hypothetical protein [Nitrosomonadales bacterium]
MKKIGDEKRAVAILLIASLCGCGTTASLEPARYASSADKWVGHTVDELIVANGEPVRVHRLVSGGRVFEYVMDSASSKSQARALKRPSTGKSGGQPCKILFAVSASDVVESWSVEGDRCN